VVKGTLREFLDALASRAPVPGGGSAAALVGALGAALTSMVAALTVDSPAYADVAASMKVLLGRSEALREELQSLVEQDSRAYGGVAAAFRMPKSTAAEEEARGQALQQALVGATETPLQVQRAAYTVAELAARAAEQGNRNVVSDAGVAALLAEAACRAAALNVRINTPYLADGAAAQAYRAEADELVKSTSRLAAEALALTDEVLE